VTKHHLNEADVGPVLQHVSRAGVAEQVTRTRRGNPGVGDISLHGVPEAVSLE
jgi:hypothetical protein